MNPLLQGALLSLTPFFELRGGLLLAVAQGASPIAAYAVCVLANIIIVPIIFLFLEFAHHRLLPIKTYKQTFNYFLGKVRKRSKKKIEKWGYLGLVLLVAIPLPVTGAYTGTLAAWLFGMKKMKAFAFIALGVAIAGLIVLAMSFPLAELLKLVGNSI